MAGDEFPGIFPYCVNPRLKRSPELLQFVQTCQESIDLDDPGTFWSCEDQFRDLARSGFLAQVVNADLERVSNEPSYIPDGATEDTLTIVNTDRFNLVFKIMEPVAGRGPAGIGRRAPRLASLPEHAMIWNIGAVPLNLHLFRLAEPYDNTVLDRSRPLEALGPSSVDPQTLLKLRAGKDLYLASEVEEQLPLLVFTSKTFLPLIWRFDPETLLPSYAIAANPRSSRLQFAASLLSKLGSAEDVSALEGLLEYPDHFVRWSVVKNIMALDEDRGMRALRVATSDPHPHVSRAAKRSLERILASENLDPEKISGKQESPIQAQS